MVKKKKRGQKNSAPPYLKSPQKVVGVTLSPPTPTPIPQIISKSGWSVSIVATTHHPPQIISTCRTCCVASVATPTPTIRSVPVLKNSTCRSKTRLARTLCAAWARSAAPTVSLGNYDTIICVKTCRSTSVARESSPTCVVSNQDEWEKKIAPCYVYAAKRCVARVCR